MTNLRSRLYERLAHATSEEDFSACVVGVVRSNGERMVLPFGAYPVDGVMRPTREDTIFDVASLTKVIPTSALALMLLDQGRIRLDDQLIAYVPEFRNRRVLVRHLLTQTLAHTVQLSLLKEQFPEAILDRIMTAEFAHPPGTTYFYSNATSILLGLLVERVMGEKLDRLGEKYFFEPLGMRRTLFRPLNKFSKEEIVPTEMQPWRGGIVHGEVHDESAFALEKKHVVGSAGLFSTVPDTLFFLQMILNHGTLNGHRYFSEAMVGEMDRNQIKAIGGSAGLGWELNADRFMGKLRTPSTIGKTGFTGCSILCDRRRDVGIVLLSNYTYPTRKSDNVRINAVRSDVADIVFSLL